MALLKEVMNLMMDTPTCDLDSEPRSFLSPIGHSIAMSISLDLCSETLNIPSIAKCCCKCCSLLHSERVYCIVSTALFLLLCDMCQNRREQGVRCCWDADIFLPLSHTHTRQGWKSFTNAITALPLIVHFFKR